MIMAMNATSFKPLRPKNTAHDKSNILDHLKSLWAPLTYYRKPQFLKKFEQVYLLPYMTHFWISHEQGNIMQDFDTTIDPSYSYGAPIFHKFHKLGCLFVTMDDTFLDTS